MPQRIHQEIHKKACAYHRITKETTFAKKVFLENFHKNAVFWEKKSFVHKCGFSFPEEKNENLEISAENTFLVILMIFLSFLLIFLWIYRIYVSFFRIPVKINS